MDEPEIISATEASRSFSELLHRVCYGGQSFIIKKGNRLMARITPVEVVAPDNVSSDNTVTENNAVTEADIHELLPDGVTPEEAEYYQTVVAQMRKRVPEPCE